MPDARDFLIFLGGLQHEDPTTATTTSPSATHSMTRRGPSIWAQSTPNTYTGCLGGGGDITRVNIGTSPISPCPKTQTQISWNQRGPPGANGDDGTDGEDGQQGPPGISKTFWSGVSSDDIQVFEGLSGAASVAETGPIPKRWLTIMGQLKVSNLSVGLPDAPFVSCTLRSSDPGDLVNGEYTDGVEIAQLLDGHLLTPGTSVTIPIRLIHSPESLGDANVVNIQCSAATLFDPGINVNLLGDLLVIPTEEGQLGVAQPQ